MAWLAGAAGALAMPPYGLLPALAPSLTVAVWLIDGCATDGRFGPVATLWAAARAGWAWGFGYFVAGLWWLGAAFLVEAGRFAWASPLGVLGVPAVLALFPAAGFALARVLWSPGAGRVFALAFGLGLAEWLRGHLFGGFPWNALGMALAQNDWLTQGASLVGLYGLSVIAVLIGAAPATLATGATTRERWLPPTLAFAALALLAVFGAWRLSGGEVPAVADVRLRIMQPNVAQDAPFRPEDRDAIMRRYLAVSARANGPEANGLAGVTHLIWPESAFPFLLHRDPRALAQIAALLPRGATLITGAGGRRIARRGRPSPLQRRQGRRGRRRHPGDLRQEPSRALRRILSLCPRRTAEGLGPAPVRSRSGRLRAGRTRLLLRAPGLPPVAATICYEDIFQAKSCPWGCG